MLFVSRKSTRVSRLGREKAAARNVTTISVVYMPCYLHLPRFSPQEMVTFCKTLNAPACGVFCEGELGPLATLVGGIQPKIAGPHLQAVTTCTAALCWSPPGRAKSRASSATQR